MALPAVSEAINLTYLSGEHLFPVINQAYINQAAAAGWECLGVGTSLVDPKGRIIVQSHQAREKNHQDALGVTTETVKYGSIDKITAPTDVTSPTGKHFRIEPTMQTLQRGISTELGIDPTTLGLRVNLDSPWFQKGWNEGPKYGAMPILGICPVLYINSETAEKIVEEFEPTREVSAVQLLTIDELGRNNNLRSITPGWLAGFLEAGYSELPDEDHLVSLPLERPLFLANAANVALSAMGFQVNALQTSP